MELETEFHRLRTPVTIDSRFGDWEVTWQGGGPGTAVVPRDGGED
jgi:hypothetical protein